MKKALLLLHTLLCTTAVSTYAATISVTTLGDAGSGSLRQAIIDVNAGAGGDTVRFADGLNGQSITLTSSLPQITKSCAITGNVNAQGQPAITVNGNNAGTKYTIFQAAGGTRCAFENLIITGSSQFGIAVYGDAVIRNVTSNSNTTGIGIAGNATITNVACVGNSNRGIAVPGKASIANTTCSGNGNEGIAVDGSAVITNATCCGNKYGISTFNATTANANVYNAIAYGNATADLYRVTGTLNVYSTVYGIESGTIAKTACSTTDPSLMPYDKNGGAGATGVNIAYYIPMNASVSAAASKANMTVANLKPGSNAFFDAQITQAFVDNATNFDQIGSPRRFDAGGSYVPGAAVKAVKNITVNGIGDNISADAFTTLREAIATVNAGSGVDFYSITFDPTVFPPAGNTTITLLNNFPQVDRPCTITGNVNAQGKPAVTIKTNGRVAFYVNDTVTIKNLTITGSSNNGIRVLAGADATIDNVTCNNNTWPGIEVLSGASAAISNATCNGSTSLHGIQVDGTATITNVTCSGNAQHGIMVSGSATITNVTCSSNLQRGIMVSGSATITSARCYGNGFTGIAVSNSSGVATATIANTICSGNMDGISCTHSSATIINTTCSGNTQHGIYIASYSTVAIANTTCFENSFSGINASDVATIYNSIFYRNNTSGGTNFDLFQNGGTLNVYNTVYGTTRNLTEPIATCTKIDGISKRLALLGCKADGTAAATTSEAAYYLPIATGFTLDEVASRANMTVANLKPVAGNAFLDAQITQAFVDNATNSDQIGSSRRFDASGKYIPGAVDSMRVVSETSFVVSNTNGAGAGSLHEAMVLANASTGSGGITITFDPTVFDGTPKSITLASGLPQIDRPCTITGNVDAQGKPSITINANGKAAFYVNDTVTIKNLIVEASSNNGIRVLAGADATIDNVTCNNNTWPGIEVLSGASAAISNATCNGSTGYHGIHIDGTATITNATCSGNKSYGILVNGSATIANARCCGNTSVGIKVDGSATVTNTTCSGNQDNGITVSGSATITGSTCSGNSIGGIWLYGTATVNIYNSIFYENNTSNTIDTYDLDRSGGTLRVYNTVYGTGSNTITFGSGSQSCEQVAGGKTLTLHGHKADGTSWFSGTDAKKDLAYYIPSATGFTLAGVASKANMTVANLKPVSSTFFDAQITQAFVNSATGYDQLGRQRFINAANGYMPGSTVAPMQIHEPLTFTDLGANDKYHLVFHRSDINHQENFHAYTLKAHFVDGTPPVSIGGRITRRATGAIISTVFPSLDGSYSGKQFRIGIYEGSTFLGETTGVYQVRD